MKPALIALAALLIIAAGCEPEAVKPDPDVSGGEKLTREEAQQYQGLVPGSRKSEQAAQAGQGE
jgi:hypothetical protein